MWHYKLVALVGFLLTHSIAIAAFAAIEVKPQHRSSGVVITPSAVASAVEAASAPAVSTCFITKPCEPVKPMVKKPRPKKVVVKKTPPPALVEVVKPEAATAYTAPPVVAHAPTECTEPQKMRLIVWEPKALEVKGVREAIEATKPDTNGFYKPNRVSRAFGGTFRALRAKGELEEHSAPQRVMVTHIRGTTETRLFEGTVTGDREIPVPRDLSDDDVVKVYFPESGKLVSPLNGDLRGLGKEFVKGACGAVTNFHAIAARRM